MARLKGAFKDIFAVMKHTLRAVSEFDALFSTKANIQRLKDNKSKAFRVDTISTYLK